MLGGSSDVLHFPPTFLSEKEVVLFFSLIRKNKTGIDRYKCYIFTVFHN